MLQQLKLLSRYKLGKWNTGMCVCKKVFIVSVCERTKE